MKEIDKLIEQYKVDMNRISTHMYYDTVNKKCIQYIGIHYRGYIGTKLKARSTDLLEVFNTLYGVL